MAALIIGQREKANLQRLRNRAAAGPIDILKVAELVQTPTGLKRHRKRMGKDLTVELPERYRVTYSVELNHPIGTIRHMSMSTQTAGRAPTPDAVWMVAEELGFVGSLGVCQIWTEDIGENELGSEQVAINLAQPLETVNAGGHA